jgi:8-oxo-dGTP pyrophosphatase MutT (NUDIX family)
MHRPRDGANLVVRKGKGQILIVRANYGEMKLLLPGGGVELGETPEQAAVRELEEETGLIANVMDLRPIATFVQLVPTESGLVEGSLHLFETRKVRGEKFTAPTCEIHASGYMEIGEIVSRQSEFGLGYRRMIYQYLRCVSGLSPVPFNGRLRDEVERPLWATRKPIVLSI